jgi:hypothetical protein
MPDEPLRLAPLPTWFPLAVAALGWDAICLVLGVLIWPRRF